MRIIYFLSRDGKKSDAKSISEAIGVTTRFSLKILRKLTQAGYIKSFKGASGGYMLQKPANEITLHDVITLIDGPIEINKCLRADFDCTRMDDKNCCPFHIFFEQLSADIAGRLSEVTFADVD